MHRSEGGQGGDGASRDAVSCDGAARLVLGGAGTVVSHGSSGAVLQRSAPLQNPLHVTHGLRLARLRRPGSRGISITHSCTYSLFVSIILSSSGFAGRDRERDRSKDREAGRGKGRERSREREERSGRSRSRERSERDRERRRSRSRDRDRERKRSRRCVSSARVQDWELVGCQAGAAAAGRARMRCSGGLTRRRRGFSHGLGVEGDSVSG